MISPRNKTVHLTDSERTELKASLLQASEVNESNYLNSTVCGDTFEVLPKLPREVVDLLIIDPPYNLRKRVGKLTFPKRKHQVYADYLRALFAVASPLLKSTATIYICSDWYTSLAVQDAVRGLWTIRNRITWQRKSPGAQRNWKNAHEDVWFCTVSDSYTFNVVKTRKRVLFPYKHDAKDWTLDSKGQAWRDEYPSNVWTDITPPFWSMSENTDHPTQKPEKFCAKLILASSNPGDVVLSPFGGVATDSVVAKKLGRSYINIELQEDFALIGQKRLLMADTDKTIQGYSNGVFYERNCNRNINF